MELAQYDWIAWTLIGLGSPFILWIVFNTARAIVIEQRRRWIARISRKG